MRNSNTDKNAGAGILAAITLTCYVTTLAALLAVGYSVFLVAAGTLDENIFAAYTRQLF
jgi:ABC-type phosphate transport system permease subunit